MAFLTGNIDFLELMKIGDVEVFAHGVEAIIQIIGCDDHFVVEFGQDPIFLRCSSKAYLMLRRYISQ